MYNTFIKGAQWLVYRADRMNCSPYCGETYLATSDRNRLGIMRGFRAVTESTSEHHMIEIMGP